MTSCLLLNVYINGILSPKDVDHSEAMMQTFGGTIENHLHIHNPLLAIEDPYQLVVDAYRSNPSAFWTAGAASAGVLLLGKAMFPDADMKKYLALALKNVLFDRAKSFQTRLRSELRSGIENLRKKFESTGVLRVNIFAHSHGGMCLDMLLNSDDYIQQLARQFKCVFHVYIAGCPILVSMPSFERTTIPEFLQFNNKNDPLSLVFEKHPNLATPHVVTDSRPFAHGSEGYLEWVRSRLVEKAEHVD